METTEFDDILALVNHETIGESDEGKQLELDLEADNVDTETVVNEPVTREEPIVKEQSHSELEEAQALIASLREELVKLTTTQPQTTQVYPQTTTTVPDTTVAIQPQTTTQNQPTIQPLDAFKKLIETTEYLSKDELDEVIDKPELINKAIHGSVKNVISTLTDAMPQLINEAVRYRIMVNSAITEFYDANQDLRPFAGFVGSVLTQQEQINKDKTYGEIFELTAQECRKRLGLKAPGSTDPGSSTTRPAFAGTRKGTGTKPATGQGAGWFDANAADLFSAR
jgi:hypothetical protein